MFNREGVTDRIRSRRRWLTVTSEGGIRLRPVFFFLFFFFFSFPFARPLFWARRRPSRRVGRGKKKKYLDLLRRRYTPLSLLPTWSFFLPNCGLPCRKMHGQLGRRTWNYGSLRLQAPPTRPPFPIPVATKRADMPTTSHPSLCVRTRKSAIFIFFLRR